MDQNFQKILLRALLIASIVGPILVFINQFEALLGDGTLSWWKIVFTLCVPFTVATISGLLAKEAPVARPAPIVPLPAVKPQEQPIPQIDLSPALALISKIKANAANVNKTSTERVTFIETLISQFEEVNRSVEFLGNDAVAATQVIQTVNTTTHQMTHSIEGLQTNTSEVVADVSAFLATSKVFSDHFIQVKDATSALNEFSMKIRLLSLNASVEAARAGEAGAGFSIIAEEVRTLAEKSSDDTGRIAEVIKAMEGASTQMSAQISDLESRLNTTQLQTDACFDQAGQAEQDIGELSKRLTAFSADIANQLPAVVSLIRDVGQIKQNTQAAVTGSANNVALCDEALRLLKPVEHLKAAS